MPPSLGGLLSLTPVPEHGPPHCVLPATRGCTILHPAGARRMRRRSATTRHRSRSRARAWPSRGRTRQVNGCAPQPALEVAAPDGGDRTLSGSRTRTHTVKDRARSQRGIVSSAQARQHNMSVSSLAQQCMHATQLRLVGRRLGCEIAAGGRHNAPPCERAHACAYHCRFCFHPSLLHTCGAQRRPDITWGMSELGVCDGFEYPRLWYVGRQQRSRDQANPKKR